MTGTVALGKNSMTLSTTTEKVMSGVKGEEGRAFVKETLNSAVEAVKEAQTK